MATSSAERKIDPTIDIHDEHDIDMDYYNTSLRRTFLGILSSYPLFLSAFSDSASAVPPISIIAEELGYFPVTNREGDTVFIPSRISRTSTPQSIALASHLKQISAVMIGAYWCPHCRHQKELFGKEAWSLINYVEASPRGFGYDPKLLDKLHTTVDGFPTWIFPSGNGGKLEKVLVGEVPLKVLADVSTYVGTFDETLEPVDSSASGSCR